MGISMKRTGTVLAALLLAVSAASAAGVAVIGPESSYGEFDTAFARLGWEADHIVDTKDSLEKFFETLDGYELILISPLMGSSTKLDGQLDVSPLRRYLEGGGMLVITDATYPALRHLLDPAVGDLARLPTGNCTSSQWGVNGYTRNLEPVHPIRSFPNETGHPDSWPHFQSAGEPWTVLAVCSEGKPVMLYREVGRGCVVASTLRHTDPAEIENFRAFGRLHASGFPARSLSLTELAPGEGRLSIDLSLEVPPGSTLTFSVANAKGEERSFSTDIAGKTIDLPFDIPWRGTVTTTLAVDTGGGRKELLVRKRTLPPLMEVGPNAYRGILSTKRRLDDVKFPVRLAPSPAEDLGGAKLALAVFDATSNKVAFLETEVPTNDVPPVLWIPVPLDKDLDPGTYRIDALLTKDRPGGQPSIEASSSASFEIVAPRLAQTIIDEDGTFLVNGRPFFPLGIYHTRNERFPEIADLGFNTIQFWRWQVWQTEEGSARGLDLALAYGLRCLFESNHGGRMPLTQCVTGFRDHPALLMWYVGDEPAEASDGVLTLNNSIWHDNDKNHPTYICSCRPDLVDHQIQFSDVFACNHYGIPSKTLERVRVLEEKVAPHKSSISVNWAAEGEGLRYLRPSAYIAIVHNVRGIIWYCWNQVGGGPIGEGIHDNPEVFPTYKELLSELRYLFPGLYSTTRRPFEEGPVHGIALGAPDAVGKRFLVTINTTTNEVAADFVVPELRRVDKVYQPFLPKVERLGADGKPVKDEKGEVVLDEPSLAIEKGRLTRTYKPWETYVLRW